MDPNVLAATVAAGASIIVASVSGVFAYKAAKYAKPTGNGFAGKVIDALARVESELGAVRANVANLQKADDEQDERILRIEMTKVFKE